MTYINNARTVSAARSRAARTFTPELLAAADDARGQFACREQLKYSQRNTHMSARHQDERDMARREVDIALTAMRLSAEQGIPLYKANKMAEALVDGETAFR